MIHALPILSALAGLALAALALRLAWRGRADLRSPYGLGLLGVFVSGLLLTGAAAYKLARLRADPDLRGASWNGFLHRYENEPFGELRLRLWGPDPFRERPQSCRLLLSFGTDPQQLDFVSQVSPERMKPVPSPGKDYRTYVIPWEEVVAGAPGEYAQERARAHGTLSNLVRAQIFAAVLDQDPEIGELPELLSLTAGKDPALHVFLAARHLEDVQGQEGGWLIDYPPSFAPNVGFIPEQWKHMALLDEYTGRLAGWHAGIALLLVISTALAFLWPAEPDRSATALLVLATLGFTAAGMCFGEKIPVAGGYGYDGEGYGLWAQNWPNWVGVGFDAFSIQRVLPSAVVYHTLLGLGVPRTPLNVICTFGLMNVGWLTLAAFAWCRVAALLGLDRRGTWLGFMAVFLNWFALKFLMFYPVLTDATTMAIGLLMLRYYLTGNSWAVAALTVAGAFTWPVLLQGGLCMLIFPRQPAEDVCEPARPRWNVLLAGALAGAYFVYAAWLVVRAENVFTLFVAGRTEEGLAWLFQRLGLDIERSYLDAAELIGISAVLGALYLFFAYRSLFDCQSYFSPRYVLGRLLTVHLLAGLVFFVALMSFMRWCAPHPAPPSLALSRLLNIYVGESLRWPGAFLVALVTSLGPPFLLAVLRWPAVCRWMHQHGLALTLCTTFGLVLSLDGEGRHILTFYYLLVVPFIVMAVRELNWPAWVYFALTLLALAFSKVWAVTGATLEDFQGLYDFPVQWYWMNMSPWMSWTAYWVQGAAVALVAAGLLWLKRKAGCRA